MELSRDLIRLFKYVKEFFLKNDRKHPSLFFACLQPLESLEIWLAFVAPSYYTYMLGIMFLSFSFHVTCIEEFLSLFAQWSLNEHNDHLIRHSLPSPSAQGAIDQLSENIAT